MENVNTNEQLEQQEQTTQTNNSIRTYTQNDVDNLLNIQKNKVSEANAKYDAVLKELKELKSQINANERRQAMLDAGVDEAQLKNVGIILQDVPNDKLAEVLQSDDSYLVFLKPKSKPLQTQQQPIQNTNQEPQKPKALNDVYGSVFNSKFKV